MKSITEIPYHHNYLSLENQLLCPYLEFKCWLLERWINNNTLLFLVVYDVALLSLEETLWYITRHKSTRTPNEISYLLTTPRHDKLHLTHYFIKYSLEILRIRWFLGESKVFLNLKKRGKKIWSNGFLLLWNNGTTTEA